MRRFKLPYGDRFYDFEIDSKRILRVLRPKTVKPAAPSESLLLEALAHPIDSVSLTDLFDRPESTVVVVPDKTRNCRAPEVLPILLNELNTVGVDDPNIKILIASGSHAAHSPADLEQVIGAETVGRAQIIEHDCRNEENLAYLGETGRGTPVLINSHVIESPKVIVLGTVVHHYFAGYGGGLKMINPGCAGYRTITKNHALTIDATTGGIHEKCRAGVLDGNPVQEDLRESMRFVEIDFAINVILNTTGEIVRVFCGDLLAAHEQACEFVDEMYLDPISERADLVVASCGGFPRDINLIQSHKALYNAFQAVKEEGVIILLAECREGIGSNTFLNWFEFDDEQEMLLQLCHAYTLNGTTALSLRHKARAARIILVSELPPALIRKLGMIPARTPENAWSHAKHFLPASYSAFIMPNASLTLPSGELL